MKKIFYISVFCFISLLARPLQIGEDAPLFVLKDQEGFTHNLVSHRGNFVLLFFYTRDYTFRSQLKVKQVEKMLSKSLNEKLIVYGISKDTVEEQRKFYDKMHISFDLLADIDGSVEKAYQAKSFFCVKPLVILIGPDGRLFRIYDNMQKALDSSDLITSIIKGSI